MKINNKTSINTLHNEQKLAKELIYAKCGFDFTNAILHKESMEYGACSFELDGKKIQYRVAKITPTKTGQFVTIWKRNKDGITAPFDILDPIDFIIISARKDDNFGQFIFPKSVLFKEGILSGNNKKGKRGIRVYAPWDLAENKQAIITQQWQIAYFLEIKDDNSTDFDLAIKLLQIL
jgi:hypothetical protein